MQEPAEPDAFPFTPLADPVHAVVPVACADQRQAVFADGETLVEPTRAMLEQGSTLVRDHGLEVGIVFAGLQHLAVEEWNESASLFEHCARGLDQSLAVG